MNKVLFLLFGIAMFAGCKKNNSSSCTLSSTTILGSYIRTADISQKTPSSPIIDELSLEQPCDRDDILTLKSDGTYTWADGVLVCGTRPNGHWSLNGTKLTTDSDVSTIQSFDCTTLVITSADLNGNNRETTTFTRQ